MLAHMRHRSPAGPPCGVVPDGHPYIHAPIHPIHPCSHTETQTGQDVRVMRAGPGNLCRTHRFTSFGRCFELAFPPLRSCISVCLFRPSPPVSLSPYTRPWAPWFSTATRRIVTSTGLVMYPSPCTPALLPASAPLSIGCAHDSFGRRARARDGCRRSSHRPRHRRRPSPPIRGGRPALEG